MPTPRAATQSRVIILTWRAATPLENRANTAVQLQEFDYDLPLHLIAQQPLPQRDQSRLLVVRRGGPVVAHHIFRDLPNLLEQGDLLVLNDTRVLPARLFGRRARTGGKWEGLFLQEH